MKSSLLPFESLFNSPLVSDLKNFRLDKLNIPVSLKSQFRSDLGIQTVSQFMNTFHPVNPPLIGFGPKLLQAVCQEITILSEIGRTRYLAEVSLETKTFSQLTKVISKCLPPREGLIFDHRLCPLDSDFRSLQQLGNQLRLSRERVRQIENDFIHQFSRGPLRDFGSIIHRKTIECFTPPSQLISFEALLHYPFFAGIAWDRSSTPVPFFFLEKVFPLTFTLIHDFVKLKEPFRFSSK